MDAVVLGLHNLVRWIVIGTGVWAVVRAWRGWLKRASWTPAVARAVRIFVGALDIQLLLGVLLYAAFSPLTHRAFRDMSAAMRDPPVRYFLVEHSTVMLLAIAAAHIGLAKAKRQGTDLARFQTASLWLGVALAAILGFVPWARPLLPRF